MIHFHPITLLVIITSAIAVLTRSVSPRSTSGSASSMDQDSLAKLFNVCKTSKCSRPGYYDIQGPWLKCIDSCADMVRTTCNEDCNQRFKSGSTELQTCKDSCQTSTILSFDYMGTRAVGVQLMRTTRRQ